MATRIRLARGGKKKRPYYRIVVADSRSPRDGRFIERIGSYDPLLAENKVQVNVERAQHWLDVGAKPSDRVAKLLALQGMAHKLIVLPQPKAEAPAKGGKGGKTAAKAEAKAEPKAEKAEAPAAEAPAEAAAEAEAAPAAEESAS